MAFDRSEVLIIIAETTARIDSQTIVLKVAREN